MLLDAIVMGSVVIPQSALFYPLPYYSLPSGWSILTTLLKLPEISVRVLLSLFLALRSSLGPLCSGTQEVPVFGGWFLHVGLPLVTMCYSTQLPTPGWEFMTTLGYEWNIIHQRLRYRWTIWVRNHSPFFLICSGKKI